MQLQCSNADAHTVSPSVSCIAVKRPFDAGGQNVRTAIARPAMQSLLPYIIVHSMHCAENQPGQLLALVPAWRIEERAHVRKILLWHIVVKSILRGAAPQSWYQAQGDVQLKVCSSTHLLE